MAKDSDQEPRWGKRFIALSALAVVAASAGDLVSVLLGFFCPGYNHLESVMNVLGMPQSPVAGWMNGWWIVFGVSFVAFEIGMGVAPKPKPG